MNKPVLFDDGSIIVKEASKNVFAETEKLVNVGVAGFTTNVEVIVPVVKSVVSDWSAVIIELPAPTIVITFSSTVATDKFELV